MTTIGAKLRRTHGQTGSAGPLPGASRHGLRLTHPGDGRL